MRIDGRLFGRFARHGKSNRFHGYFPCRGLSFEGGLAVDGIPCKADLGNHFPFLPDYVDYHGCLRLYHDTNFIEKAFAKEQYIGNDNNPYVCVVREVDASITEITINSGCRVIANAAFVGCEQAKSATIPEGVVTIGKNAFNSCRKLSSVSFPNSLEVIGESAFVYCTFKDVSLTGNVKFIGQWAFSNCYYIENITLGRKVERMEYAVFASCKFLESFIYEGTVEEFKKIKVDALISWDAPLSEISCLDGSIVIDG